MTEFQQVYGRDGTAAMARLDPARMSATILA